MGIYKKIQKLERSLRFSQQGSLRYLLTLKRIEDLKNELKQAQYAEMQYRNCCFNAYE